MDLISNNAIELTTLALNGLSARHNALAANVANADTTGYKRSDIKFEDQLVQILEKEKAMEAQKVQNSAALMYTPSSLASTNDLNSSFNAFGSFNAATGLNLNNSNNPQELYKKFNPELTSNDEPAVKADGNNVSIEFEMAELAKNGTKYTAIATFQERMFRGLQEVIQRAGGS